MLGGAAVPYAASQVRNQAAEKVAREMLAVADAAKSYYVANAAWPPSIGALQSAGYLPSGWSPQNPFGNAYAIASAGTLTIESTVPSDVAPVVARLVPLASQGAAPGGTRVAGTWPRPGQSSDLSSVGLPKNAVVFYDGPDCGAAGLTELTGARGRVIVGRPSGGTLGGTVGVALADLENRAHTHPYSDVIAHTHTVNDPGHSHGYLLALGQTSRGMRAWGSNLVYHVAADTTTASTGISLAPAGVATGTTHPQSASTPYLQLTVCKKP